LAEKDWEKWHLAKKTRKVVEEGGGDCQVDRFYWGFFGEHPYEKKRGGGGRGDKRRKDTI